VYSFPRLIDCGSVAAALSMWKGQHGSNSCYAIGIGVQQLWLACGVSSGRQISAAVIGWRQLAAVSRVYLTRYGRHTHIHANQVGQNSCVALQRALCVAVASIPSST
jgi:hypothetical protein